MRGLWALKDSTGTFLGAENDDAIQDARDSGDLDSIPMLVFLSQADAVALQVYAAENWSEEYKSLTVVDLVAEMRQAP